MICTFAAFYRLPGCYNVCTHGLIGLPDGNRALGSKIPINSHNLKVFKIIPFWQQNCLCFSRAGKFVRVVTGCGAGST